MFKLPYGDFVWDSRLFEVDGEIVLHLGRVATAYGMLMVTTEPLSRRTHNSSKPQEKNKCLLCL
jgi:hypothetical protein